METKVNFKQFKIVGWAIVFALFIAYFVACSLESGTDYGFSSGEGTGGSMARFTIANNYLYTVDQSSLKVFDLTNPEIPVFKKNKQVGFGIETIFPLNKNLFLGTSTGMYIYDVRVPNDPKQVSFYEHVVSCDPVVSDGQYAYVTLNSSSQRCWRSVNELQIINLQNLNNPELVKQYQMTGPQGLSIRNDTLWLCDDGLKIFDVSDKMNIRLIRHFKNIAAYDVILNKQLALIVGETGFVQYKFENDTIIKLSEINVQL